MEKIFNGAERINLLAQELVSQISMGKKETVKEIIAQMGNKSVVRYLYKKYRSNWLLSLDDDCPYNVDDWEELFFRFSNITEYDALRKWGIHHKDDGLLLLLSLTLEILRDVLP